MLKYEHILKTDYDKRVKLGDNYVFCYSKKKLKELYPDESGYSLCGEAWRGTGQSQDKYEEKQRKRLEKLKESGKADLEKTTLKVGDLHMGGSVLGVYLNGTNEAVLSKADGYVCVGENRFIALHSSRIPFFAAVGSLSVAIIATVIIIAMILGNAAPPVVIDPDNPLPDLDPSIVPSGEETVEIENIKDGGWSYTYIQPEFYSLSLSEEILNLYFKNPSVSNCDAVLEIYFINDADGTEHFIGRSGRVPAGSVLTQMSVKDRQANISVGSYYVVCQIFLYDPETGEQGYTVPKMNLGDKITVTE